MTALAIVVLFCSWSSEATTLQAEVEVNPIRKIVTLLQDMQHEIEAESAKEQKLFDKFMCFCDGNTDGMGKSAEDAQQKITELSSKLEAEQAEHSRLTQELVEHKSDRQGAKKDLEEASAIREKEHAEYVESTGDQKANVDALGGAISALEKGMGAKALVQMPRNGLARVTQMVRTSSDVDDEQRDDVVAFLQGKQNPFGDYGSQSGEIVGILKAMHDEMDKDLNGAVSAEEEAQAGFEQLAAAKQSEIKASSEAIESKQKRNGDLAVAVVTTKDDIEDTTADMSETQGFLANLGAQCAQKKKEWAERSQTRAQEVAAISEAISILNDDDALDLFKKTISLTEKGAAMGFLQKESKMAVVSRARAMFKQLSHSSRFQQTQLSLIASALKAKNIDFSKITAMIDDMVTNLGNEQNDDDAHKTFCDNDLAKSAQEKKDTQSAIAASAASIEEMQDASATLSEEIAALQKEIKELDKAVAEATEQRKEEHADFVAFQSDSTAASQLVEKAKNRLFKFYRPNLHKEEPTRELSYEEKIMVSQGVEVGSDLIPTNAPSRITSSTQDHGTVYAQVRAHSDGAPPPPPETWDAYQKKDGKSNGVIALMEMLLTEVKDDLSEATHDEKTGQSDYEKLMASSQATRAKNVESITTKESAKADLDMKIEATKQKKTSQEAELMNTNAYIAQLHSDCDFLVDNYDLRKQARASEVDSLKNSKAVLGGASFA